MKRPRSASPSSAEGSCRSKCSRCEDKEVLLPLVRAEIDRGVAHRSRILRWLSKTAEKVLRKIQASTSVESSFDEAGSDRNEEWLQVITESTKLHHKLWSGYQRDSKRLGERRAREIVELEVAKQYEKLHELASALLLCIAPGDLGQEEVAGSSYGFVEFQGRQVGNDKSDDLGDRLARQRNWDLRSAAKDALCAVLSCLCCRTEKAWLEDFDDERPVRGYFAHALVEASSRFRIAMGTEIRAASRLACLQVTFEMPFGKALEHMDFGGPLPAGHLRLPRARRQYALQEILVKGGRGKEKLRPAENLKPESSLKAALYNDAPAILLDVYAALAPRTAVKEHGLGEVVKAEFMGLLHRAKKERKILIFMLGGPSPVELAEKVYLKEHYVAMGLRCGFLRWRETPKDSWRRQKCFDQRLILGLAMP